jgi:hypothetical protein
MKVSALQRTVELVHEKYLSSNIEELFLSFIFKRNRISYRMNPGYDLKLDETTSFHIFCNLLFTARSHDAELSRTCLNKSTRNVAQYTQFL